MSIYIARGNLFTRHSLNIIQPRVFALRLRRNVVRCLSDNTANPTFPVRYVPKRQRGVNNTQHITSVDISPKDVKPPFSDSSVFRHKGPEDTKGVWLSGYENKLPDAEVKLSNAFLDSKYELNHWNRYGKETTDKQHIKANNQALDYMKAEASDKDHIKVYEGVDNCMKTPEVIAQESAYETCGQSKGFILNKQSSSEELLNKEPEEVPDDVRYVSRRHGEVNKTQHITSVSISPKDGMPHHNGPEGTNGLCLSSLEDKLPNAEVKLSNALLDSKYELNHWDSYGKETTDKQHIKALDCMKVEASNKEHIKVYERVIDHMKVPEVTAQESVYENRGLSKGFKPNDNSLSVEILSEEYMEEPKEVPEDVFEEEHLTNAIVDGELFRTKNDAEKLAVKLLGKRAFTAVELRKKLMAKEFPNNIVEPVLRDFQTRGFLNDGMYAEIFSHSRWKSSSWGPRRINQALKVKGVAQSDVQKAVKLVFEDSEESDKRSSIKLSSSALEQLYFKALKQWQRSQNVHHETCKTRMVRWLQYRGFDWGVISTIMKKLESQKP